MRELISLIQQHAPDVAEVYGANLYTFLLRGVFWARGIPWPEAWEPKLERLSPGHPLIFHGDGRYSGLEAMTVEHFYEYRDYQRSLAPPQNRGPKKKPAKQRHPGLRPIDPSLARRAAEMAAEGHHWTEIAAEIFPNERYRDDKERDRLYKRVDRAIEKGNLLGRNKKPDAQM